MKSWLAMESEQFRSALEAAIEQRRGRHHPGGFVIPEKLESALDFSERAQTIARLYGVTTEQACFAIVGAMIRLGWLKK